MLMLQRYFGPENYSRALDYLANYLWLFKIEHRTSIGNIIIFKIILSNYEVTLEKCSNGHAI